MAAPARVLPKEKNTEPRLALVDNVGVGEPIVDEAQRQQGTRLELIEAGEVPAPVRATRRRRQKPAERICPIRRTFTYKGPVHPDALAIAEEIQARSGGYIQKVNANTVMVTNYPPEK